MRVGFFIALYHFVTSNILTDKNFPKEDLYNDLLIFFFASLLYTQQVTTNEEEEETENIRVTEDDENSYWQSVHSFIFYYNTYV